ncbi:thioredoxin TrxC [Thauera sp. 27]|uniref:thioredoxin TrxC n=1 Tax=Thauera sp. 27 TaxID=305700 RepID=UPI0002D0A8E5|nr:thioredoxin TrxC [Thauera sp. 27]ENO81525.1 thioredoxin [Thauera sp. 27]HNR62425.1 thioredoxin TrxC [Thauera sp.]
MNESLHIVCPRCNSINRVPGSRLHEAPSCGRCHQALFDGTPIALTEQCFERHIERTDLPVLVDFWAPWCGPCKVMAPQFQQAASVLEPKVRLVKVNTEMERGLAARYGIRSIPTMVLFRGGREFARQSGALGAQDIVNWATAQLA